MKLTKGVKVIFIKYGGAISTKPGTVYTFSNYWTRELALKYSSYYIMFPEQIGSFNEKHYFQAIEILETGNNAHNLPTDCIEVFDEEKHKSLNPVFMTPELVEGNVNIFLNKWCSPEEAAIIKNTK